MRQINSTLYLTAGGLTVIIFVMGVLAGLVIEGERVDYMQGQDETQKVNFDSIQLQYLYLSSLQSNKSCQVLSNAINKYIKETDEIRVRVERYSEKSNIKSDEFSLIKREYVISQINYWLLASKTKELCGGDYVTVLYFYDKDEADSRNQGFILDYFKKMFKDQILIFALDSKFDEEPMVQILKESYAVTDEPTIIVEEEKFEGFQSTETLRSLFCSKYNAKPEYCTA